MSRGGAASKFVEDICNKLNLNCSSLTALVTGAINVTNMIRN